MRKMEHARREARSGNNQLRGEKEEEKYWVAGRLSSSKLIKHRASSLFFSPYLRVKFIILLSCSIRGIRAPPRRDIVNGIWERDIQLARVYPTRSSSSSLAYKPNPFPMLIPGMVDHRERINYENGREPCSLTFHPEMEPDHFPRYFRENRASGIYTVIREY